jgi:anti-anti-sigma factor
MKLSIIEKGPFKIVSIWGVPKGQLDLTNVKELRSKFGSHLPEESAHVILDLEKITYIDSSIIGLFVDLLNKYRNTSGSFGLVNVNPKILNILQLANLTRYFKVYENSDSIPDST